MSKGHGIRSLWELQLCNSLRYKIYLSDSLTGKNEMSVAFCNLDFSMDSARHDSRNRGFLFEQGVVGDLASRNAVE